VLGLLVIVAVPKANWALVSGFNAGGTLHRAASVVAFVCLPIAILAAARAAFPDSAGRRSAVRVLAIAALAWFGVILGAVVIATAADERWWQLIPLGLVGTRYGFDGPHRARDARGTHPGRPERTTRTGAVRSLIGTVVRARIPS